MSRASDARLLADKLLETPSSRKRPLETRLPEGLAVARGIGREKPRGLRPPGEKEVLALLFLNPHNQAIA